MSTYTENYNLIKPDEEDCYDVTEFNENMDVIDTQMMETAMKVENISEKIGTSADASTNTVFGKLNSLAEQSPSVIKSIQRVLVTISSNNKEKTETINPIDTERTFVIMDVSPEASQKYWVNYTLNSDNLRIQTESDYDISLHLGFWIIEFN